MTTFDLIAGTYTPREAQEILCKTIESKISFHEMKSFSSQIRFGHSDQRSETRLKELRAAKKVVLALIEEALATNSVIKIQAAVQIAFEPQQHTDDVPWQKAISSN